MSILTENFRTKLSVLRWAIAVSAALGVLPVTAQLLPTRLTNPIYVQSTGIPGTPAAKATLIADAGFNGMAWEEATSGLPEVLKTLHQRGKGLVGLWRNPQFDLAGDIAALDTAGPYVFMYVPLKMYGTDAQVAAAVAAAADRLAPSGRKIAIYPHAPDYVSNSLDAVRIAKLANRANVGISFNLCHELMYCSVHHLSFQPRFDSLTRNFMPYVFTASISGGDSVGDNWGVLIRPLGEGTFDTFGVVKTLMDKNFKGPFLLQAYGLTQDAKTHLAKSMTVWKDYQKKLPAPVTLLKVAPVRPGTPGISRFDLQGRTHIRKPVLSSVYTVSRPR